MKRDSAMAENKNGIEIDVENRNGVSAKNKKKKTTYRNETVSLTFAMSCHTK